MTCGQIPIPKPEGDEVLVKVHSSVINPSDTYFMRGMWGIPLKYPFTPGWEGSGDVISAGTDKHAQELVGKRVAFMIPENKGFPWTKGGTMAEYALSNVNRVVPLIDEIDYESGACSIVNPMTVLGMVDRLKQLKCKSVIITAAASQLGRMLIKVCKKEKIETIATVRKAEQAKLLDTDNVINTSDKDWLEKMGKLAAKLKPSCCLEAIAGEMTGTIMNFLEFGGTMIVYGLLSEDNVGNMENMAFM